VVDSSLIIGLVTSQRLSRALLVDQGGALVGVGGSIGRAGLDLVGGVGNKAGIDGDSQPGGAKASDAANSEKRHSGRRGNWGEE
jgi:hypothetical protein